jgi:hypothetical protein
MTRRNSVALLTLPLALAAGIASGAERMGRPTAASYKVITMDGELIRPSALLMREDDVLEFVNYSTTPIMLVFVEPQDQTDKIRCHVIHSTNGDPAEASWQLFGWSPSNQLTAVIPPGRFVSVCSLVPGQYAFVTQRIGRGVGSPPDALGAKGTITVQ